MKKKIDATILDSIEWDRKPTEYSEVESTINISTLTQLGDLDRYVDIDILPYGLTGSFSRVMPQYFVLTTTRNGSYLVDTQGYEYPRYMIRIVK